MALANWTNAQVIAQLDSHSHLTGLAWTYAFPTTSTWIPAGTEERAGFSPLNVQQKYAATLSFQLWDDLIAPTLTRNDAVARPTFEVSNISGTADYAYGYYPTVGTALGSTAWINSSAYPELAAPVVGDYSFLTFTHEIGHTLGLNHMGRYDGSVGSWATSASSQQDSQLYSVMSYFSVSETGQANWTSGWTEYFPQTPMLNDILAIQAIYGADKTTRATATTYGFNASGISALEGQIYDFSQNAHPILTIYDAGGIDTLDLSGYLSDSKIDIAAGRFTSAAGFTNNIAIAYNTVIENATGGGGNDTLLGNAVDNVLSGGAGNDRLEGLLGNDTLIGGTGADVMIGGVGNDTYFVDLASDIVTEALAQGIDTVVTSVAYTLSANVENGRAAADAGDVAITGNALNNALVGNAAANILNGGAGIDTLTGGAGNDTYILDNPSDVVVEALAGGTDTIIASFSKVLGANVENLTLSGTANLLGYGNALDNVLTANTGNTRLAGLDGNDWLYGNRGNDVLIGGNGVDYLRGGTGSDTLSGGLGADTFRFDAHVGLVDRDVITDFQARGLGQDLIDIGASFGTDYASMMSHSTLVQSGLNAILTLSGNQIITLTNVNIADISAADFTFHA